MNINKDYRWNIVWLPVIQIYEIEVLDIDRRHVAYAAFEDIDTAVSNCNEQIAALQAAKGE